MSFFLDNMNLGSAKTNIARDCFNGNGKILNIEAFFLNNSLSFLSLGDLPSWLFSFSDYQPWRRTPSLDELPGVRNSGYLSSAWAWTLSSLFLMPLCIRASCASAERLPLLLLGGILPVRGSLEEPKLRYHETAAHTVWFHTGQVVLEPKAQVHIMCNCTVLSLWMDTCYE